MMTVWVTHEFYGLHFWPDAVPVVGFLKYPHRHLFKVKLEVITTELNRGIEFLQLKAALETHCRNYYTLVPTTFSCEHMADQLRKWAVDNHLTPVTVTVSEDGENGTTWYRDIDDGIRVGGR